MRKSAQLTIRASEIKSEINALEPGDATLEKRRELLASLNTVEAEFRAALTAEEADNATAPDANGLTAEEREFRELTTKAELRQAFRAVMNGDPLAGAEKELQEHRGLSGHNIPWDMIGPRTAPRTEDRADAISSAPADSHLQQHPILGRVFARSATATLGVAMPMVATGEQNYPVVSTSDKAVILAKDAAEGDTADAGITAHVIEPKRLQRSYVFRREDQAVLGGLEEALRADLSMAVADLLDAQVLAGDGSDRRAVRRLPGDRRERRHWRPERHPGPRHVRPGGGRGRKRDRWQVRRWPWRVRHRDWRRHRPRPCEQVSGERLRGGAGLHGPLVHEDDGERERSRRGCDVPRGHHRPHRRGGRECRLSDLGLAFHDPG